jgi:hypothetical protein
MNRGEFLKLVIEVNNLGSSQGFELREQFKGLKEDAISLRAIGIGSGVVPGFLNTTMSRDYLIQAADNIIQGQHIVATVLEEAGGEAGHTVLLSMVVRVCQMLTPFVQS